MPSCNHNLTIISSVFISRVFNYTPHYNNSVEKSFSFFVLLGAALFAKSCIVYNPLVYFLAVQRFRKDVMKILLDCLGIKNQVTELDSTVQTNMPDQSLIMLETKSQFGTSRVMNIPLRTSEKNVPLRTSENGGGEERKKSKEVGC